jgi:hypothetical protein
MHPMRLDAVEPSALGLQPARDQLNASFPLGLRLQRSPVMLLDPGADMLTDMPGDVIPNQHVRVLARRFNLLAEVLQKFEFCGKTLTEH